MVRRGGVRFDVLMRDLTSLGVAALAAWVVVGFLGSTSGYLAIQPQSTLRFLLAIAVLVAAPRIYRSYREWRYRSVSPDDRFGFSDLVSEHRRTNWWREGEARSTR